MKNVIILGSGRSGTSLVAGALAKAGYNFGDNLIQPGNNNLKGFFEDLGINDINEDILFRSYPKKSPFLGEWTLENRPNTWRWLSRVSQYTKLFSSEEIRSKIKKYLDKEPFCYKDTRFSYTLPVWRPYLKNTVFVCVFREPAFTAQSIVKECNEAEYLKDINMDFDSAIDIWNYIYKNILRIKLASEKWLFLHYNQALTKKGLGKLSKFTEAKVDYSFPDKKLNKSRINRAVPEETDSIYKKLCEFAEFKI